LIAQAIVPDLIVLDLGLPDVPGREIVRRLSAVPRLRSIPVVIYSADSGSIEGATTASVLEKPVTIDEIASTLSDYLGPRRRVLVVDDDNDTRDVLCSVLRNLRVETSEASDGQEALAALRKHGADMVLLDICMPRMTGFEFLEQLRADPDLGATPVVVCTALDLQPTEAQKLVGGTQGVIRKGFNLEGRIEEVIRVLLPKIPSPSLNRESPSSKTTPSTACCSRSCCRIATTSWATRMASSGSRACTRTRPASCCSTSRCRR
jgi:CheY-like chemotaxis protein